MDNLDLVTEENIKRKQLQKRGGGESPMSFMKWGKKSEWQIEEKGEGEKKRRGKEEEERKEVRKKRPFSFFLSLFRCGRLNDEERIKKEEENKGRRGEGK